MACQLLRLPTSLHYCSGHALVSDMDTQFAGLAATIQLAKLCLHQKSSEALRSGNQ